MHPAATSIITVWWLFKPGSAFTRTTEVCAAPPAPAPRQHTPSHFKRTLSTGDDALVWECTAELCFINQAATYWLIK